ncbi:MAG: hypothetical protein HC910_07800 [Spirulinaceae cyanobacterium SM2_1_0]|nr:hypothetical protein [Spirulinaceae cyanobacterium SM2_1_0]
MADSTLVPQNFHQGIRKLALSEEEFVERFFEVCSQAHPQLKFAAVIEEILDNIEDVSAEEVESLVGFLASIYRIFKENNAPVESLTSGLIESVKQSNIPLDDSTDATLSEKQLDVLGERVKLFFETQSLIKTTFDVQAALFNHARMLRSFEITTDVRPVYKAQQGNLDVAAFVLIHEMKILTHENEEFFFTLDSDDLDYLTEQIRLAQKKEISIRASLSSTGIPCVI